MVKRVFTRKACKTGKERKGVGGRCVKKCASSQDRINGVCKIMRKAGYVYNHLSGRLVKRTGPTGKWGLGRGPPPSGYEKDMTYIQELAMYD